MQIHLQALEHLYILYLLQLFAYQNPFHHPLVNILSRRFIYQTQIMKDLLLIFQYVR